MSTGPLTIPEEFDPKTCITAKELRDRGTQIPLEISDASWVPRSAVRYDLKEAKTVVIEVESRIESIIPVHIDVDFNPPDKRSIAKVTLCGLPTCGFVPEKK